MERELGRKWKDREEVAEEASRNVRRQGGSSLRYDKIALGAKANPADSPETTAHQVARLDWRTPSPGEGTSAQQEQVWDTGADRRWLQFEYDNLPVKFVEKLKEHVDGASGAFIDKINKIVSIVHGCKVLGNQDPDLIDAIRDLKKAANEYREADPIAESTAKIFDDLDQAWNKDKRPASSSHIDAPSSSRITPTDKDQYTERILQNYSSDNATLLKSTLYEIGRGGRKQTGPEINKKAKQLASCASIVHAYIAEKKDTSRLTKIITIENAKKAIEQLYEGLPEVRAALRQSTSIDFFMKTALGNPDGPQQGPSGS